MPLAQTHHHAVVQTPQVWWYGTDTTGAPVELTDAAGETVWRAQRLAWGNLTDEAWLAEGADNCLRLPGQYEDRETGFFYNLHRYYDPRHGRYITPDPAGLAGGLNANAYVDGNPVGYVDLLGLSPLDKNGFDNIERPDFYVGPDGPEATLPSTGYRYDRLYNDDGTLNARTVEIMKNKSGIVSHFGFEKYDTGAEARNAFQVKGPEFGADINGSGSWSDGRLRSQFDTLQVFENGKPQVRVPYWGGDKMGPVLEPFAEAYPQYGSDMSLQLHANYQKNRYMSVDEIPSGMPKVIIKSGKNNG